MRKSVLFTYIKIIIVIAIIGIVAYFIANFAFEEYDKEEYETIKTDMLLIQAQTELIAQKVEIEEDDVEYIGTKIEEKEDDEKIQTLIQNQVIDIESDDSNYYCIDNEDLVELGLEGIEVEDYFIVDYESNDVIYVDGIENTEGKIVYKLSEMDIEIESDEDDNEEVEEELEAETENEAEEE